MNFRNVRKPMSWLRPVLSVITMLSITVLSYAAIYNLGRPRNPHPDPFLAARLLPVELLLGVLAGLLAYRTFGHQQQSQQRPDAEERMVMRLALRRCGSFTLTELFEESPLTEDQAQWATQRMVDTGRLSREGETYSLISSGPSAAIRG